MRLDGLSKSSTPAPGTPPWARRSLLYIAVNPRGEFKELALAPTCFVPQSPGVILAAFMAKTGPYSARANRRQPCECRQRIVADR